MSARAWRYRKPSAYSGWWRFRRDVSAADRRVRSALLRRDRRKAKR